MVTKSTGHMLGLDVHDMEDLGEVWVGYDGQPKSTQFGLKSLRLSKTLQPGHVFTIDPGNYSCRLSRPDIVDPASTLQVVNALIKAGKDLEFMMFPGQGHGSGGRYGERQKRDFFVRHLLDLETPDWNREDKD